MDIVGEEWVIFDGLVDHLHFLDDQVESFREVVVVDVDAWSASKLNMVRLDMW